MKREELKADLTLLKRYVKEIEDGLNEAYLIRDEPKPNTDMKQAYQEFMVKVFKIVGILAGITNEAGMLVGDLQKIIQYSEPKSKSSEDTMSMLKAIIAPPKSGRGEN